MVLNTRAILGSTSTDENHTVLLNIVTYTLLAQSPIELTIDTRKNPTFTGNIRRHYLPTAQSYSCSLPLTGVGLLGLRDTRLQADALHLRSTDERGGARAARSLRYTASATDLVVGCLAEGRGGEMTGDRACACASCCCDGGGCAEDGLKPGDGWPRECRDGCERRPLDQGAQGAEGEGGYEWRHCGGGVCMDEIDRSLRLLYRGVDTENGIISR
jgi:hypothetical protein